MSEKKIFKKDEVIFEENSWELSMYDIVSGKVGIYANYGKDNQTLLTELEAGRFFGEMAVIDGMPRSATAVALEDTETEYICSKDFDEYLNTNPEKVIDILQNLSKRLRELSAEYIESCETVTEYVKDEKSKKKERILNKIKELIYINAEYSELINRSYQDFPSSFNNYFLI